METLTHTLTESPATVAPSSKPPEPYPGHRLGMQRIFVPEDDGFNGTIIDTPQGKVLLYRAPPSCACVLLDEHLACIPGTHQKLDLWRNDDPRLCYEGTHLYLSTSYHGGGFRRERIELRRLCWEDDAVVISVLGKFETIEDDPCYVRVREKSWAPFGHEGRLYYVHKVQPHRVLAVDRPNGIVRLAYEVSWALPAWWQEEWGCDLRLNSAPARLDADTFLSTLHTYHERGYRTWFYTFSAHPPFTVLAVTAEPVILPGDAIGRNPRNGRHHCIFITGLQLYPERDEALLSGGNNDAHVIVLPFRLSAVLAGLRPIA